MKRLKTTRVRNNKERRYIWQNVNVVRIVNVAVVVQKVKNAPAAMTVFVSAVAQRKNSLI
jgi:ribosomal protein S2